MSKVGKISNCAEGESCQYLKRVEYAARIFQEYGSFIRNVIQYNLYEEADEEDIFQDFFLSLVSKPIPNTVKNIRPYLYRAIKNDILDAKRRAKNYRAKVQRYAEYLKYRTKSNCPNNIVIQPQEMRKMFQMLKRKLPPREFQAITERFKYDHTIGEAARRMHICEKTYSQYLWLALKKIRSIFEASDAVNYRNSNT